MRLPERLRKRVERRLTKQGFRDYKGLAQWLQRQGHEISTGSLRRYGMSLAQDLDAPGRPARPHTEAKAAMLSSATTTEGLMQLAQEKLCSALVEVGQLEQGDMSRLAHAVAHLTQAAVSLRRWTVEVHQRTEEHERTGSYSESAVQGGLSSETSQALRSALLGLSPFNPDASGLQDTMDKSEAKTPAVSAVADEFEKRQKMNRTVSTALLRQQDEFDSGDGKD
jgi:hypothetical protein